MKKMSKNLSLFLVLALVIALATGCGNKETNQTTETSSVEASVESSAVESTEESTEASVESEESSAEESSEEESSEAESSEEVSTEAEGENTDITVLGEGAVSFYFNVVTADQETTYFQINTDKTTVGEALLELGLVEGEVGDYGLYVKTVNGITADYDVDQTYWAFYIDGEYAMTGVDSTDVTAGSTYTFAVEK